MGISNAKLIEHQARVFADFPTESITISGTAYNCLVLEFETGNEWMEGGRLNSLAGRVAIERSAITGSVPVEGTAVTFRSATYRIADVDQSDAGDSVKLALTHETLGA